ncbi:T-cell surface glycoprotein CD3 epsilon chain, partial [Striga asiatica]
MKILKRRRTHISSSLVSTHEGSALSLVTLALLSQSSLALALLVPCITLVCSDLGISIPTAPAPLTARSHKAGRTKHSHLPLTPLSSSNNSELLNSYICSNCISSSVLQLLVPKRGSKASYSTDSDYSTLDASDASFSPCVEAVLHPRREHLLIQASLHASA